MVIMVYHFGMLEGADRALCSCPMTQETFWQKNEQLDLSKHQKAFTNFDRCFLLPSVVINGHETLIHFWDEVSLADKDSKAADIFGKLQALF